MIFPRLNLNSIFINRDDEKVVITHAQNNQISKLEMRK